VTPLSVGRNDSVTTATRSTMVAKVPVRGERSEKRAGASRERIVTDG
jgi:hypothetical protein